MRNNLAANVDEIQACKVRGIRRCLYVEQKPGFIRDSLAGIVDPRGGIVL